MKKRKSLRIQESLWIFIEIIDRAASRDLITTLARFKKIGMGHI